MPVLSTEMSGKLGQLDRFIDALPKLDGALIATLHEAQDLFGYLPEDVQLHIARRLQLPAAKVFGVVTFYSGFSMEKKGQHQIHICMGTACFVRGAEDVLRAFEEQLGIKQGDTTKDGAFSLDCLRCVGACGLAPVVMFGDKVYGRVKPDEVKNIIDEYLSEGRLTK